MISPRLLRAFDAVAAELHFGRAAQRLHTTQPPVSQAVQRLEAELGVALLERTTRSVRLTPAGRALVPHVHELLQQLDRTRSLAQEAVRGEHGLLRIGLTGVSAVRLFSRQASEFRDLHPGVHLDLKPFTYSGEQEHALLADEIDVGFLMHDAPQPELRTQKIWSEALVAVLPHDHALAAAETIDVRALRLEPFVTFPPDQGSELRNVLAAVCEAAGFRPRIARETSPPYMLQAFVSAGEGVTILPESTVAPHVEGLAVRRLSGLEDGARTFMAWRADDDSLSVATFLLHAREFHGIPG